MQKLSRREVAASAALAAAGFLAGGLLGVSPVRASPVVEIARFEAGGMEIFGITDRLNRFAASPRH